MRHPNGVFVMALSGLGGPEDLIALDRPQGHRIFAFPYLMFAPAFVLIASVSFIPLGYAIVQSFFRSPTLQLGRFVGLSNYSDFFLARNGFETVQNSLIFVA